LKRRHRLRAEASLLIGETEIEMERKEVGIQNDCRATVCDRVIQLEAECDLFDRLVKSTLQLP
jgi:hypothetical protein